MLFNEIEQGLKQYSKFQAKYRFFNEEQTLFYIVVDTNEVILLGSKDITSDEIHDFRNFVLSLDEIKKNYSSVEAKKLAVKCYLVGYNGELGHQRQKHLDTLVGDIFRI
jgi:hypothetical protein